MKKILPPITKEFISHIKQKAEQGVYRTNLDIDGGNIILDVYPNIFPPSEHLTSDHRDLIRELREAGGKMIADIGCGSGVLSIIAAIFGATHVDAVDVNPVAVRCTEHNLKLNSVEQRVSVYHGNLLKPLRDKRYDAIIANLPYVDYNPKIVKAIKNALCDPDLQIHTNFLKSAKYYLTKNGYVVLRRANLQSAHTNNPQSDFDEMEKLISRHGYQTLKVRTSTKLGYIWKTYRIRPRKYKTSSQ